MNRLDALKYFVVAAETLSFKNTAVRFSVSPQVITRVISELEEELGEPLFKRNTRSITLTEFGSQFVPKSVKFLQEEEQLFGSAKAAEDELSGTVRITLPPYPYHDRILHQLLTALEPYPNINIDWRTNFENLKAVDDQIDIGIRISQTPDEHWIVKKICALKEPIVASPKLIAKTGLPKDLFELVEKFPVGNILNPSTGKPWNLFIGEVSLPIINTSVMTTDLSSLLQAVLTGRIFAPIMLEDCQPYLDSGELQIVFENNENEIFSLYLYRPYQAITPKRVQVVFELLERILKKDL
ncbi:LysR family transcriptional regulator [Bisgaard Taxon 10/6]|uniref:LysR family transcriptional regulator n=1 Tax=Exercitatus varius TaxID=67857 RepID=UPI00294ABE72|nr:LysR family transcriptional regulator [Exercitatus varius]MDG2959695.1 LysR family transcriptional regulator [Exercitatus varius]